MRKVLLTMLVVTMVAALGATALAATQMEVKSPVFSDIAGKDGEWELAALGALGIFSGDSGVGGTVRPDDSITRAEFCKVVITALGKGSIAAGLAGLTPTFTDGASIPTWAWGYVNAASMMGIINGYADGTFGASKAVSYAEAVTMLVRSVPGHAAQVPASTWPYNFIWYGLDNEFVGDADISFPNLPCTRGNMAIMVYATMQVNPLNADGDPYSPSKEVLAGRTLDGILNGYSLTNKSVDIGSTAGAACADTIYLGAAPNLESLKHLNVRAIYNTKKDKILFVGPTKGSANAFAGWFRAKDYHPAGDTSGYDYLRFSDGTTIPYRLHGETVPTHVPTTMNTVALTNGEDDLVGSPVIDYVYVTKNDSGLAVSLTAERDHRFTGSEVRVWVTNVTKAASSTTPATVSVAWNGGSTVLSVPYAATVTINGAAATRNDLAKWDLLYVGYKGDDAGQPILYIHAFRKTVQGTVTAKRVVTDADGTTVYATINGAEYPLDLSPEPNIGDVVTYGFDRDDYCYVPIGYSVATNYWWIKSFTDYPGQYADIWTVNVDGSDQTYHGNDILVTPTGVGYIGLASLNASRQITAIAPVDTMADFYDVYGVVLSIDASNKIIVVADDKTPAKTPTVVTATDLVVYGLKSKWDSVGQTYVVNNPPTIGSYVGFSGLAVGDYVYYDATSHVVLLHPRDVAVFLHP